MSSAMRPYECQYCGKRREEGTIWRCKGANTGRHSPWGPTCAPPVDDKDNIVWLAVSHEFAARPATKAEDCGECWATQFTCPKCGPCTDAMVMTTKCCARCQTRPHGVGNDVGLIRTRRTLCPAHRGE